MKSQTFYREKNLEQTALGKIPKDWSIVSIGDVAETTSGGTPSRAKKEYYGGTIPWVKSGELKDNIIDNTEETITNEGLRNSSAKLFHKGTFLVALYGATVGKTGILGIDATTNQAVCAIMPKENKLDPYYLKFQIIARRNELISASSGGAQPNISQGIIRGFRIPLPALNEQHKIAGTLSIIEEAIQKTNEIITKTELLKKGLMQQLLTKGIGHKEFKYSEELGSEIPKEWTVVKLKDAICETKSGFACGKRDEKGILQLRMDSIDTEGWINVEGGVKVPVPEDVDEYLLRPGDILFNNTNSVDLIGKTAIFRGEFPRSVYSNHLTRIRVNLGKAVPEWILYVLVRKWQLGVPKAICHRHVHQAGINNEEILGLKIPLPLHSEQQKITKALSAVDTKLKLERTEKAKLEKAKQGLMDLLLTGKIRIRVN